MSREFHGMSLERLENVHALLSAYVDQGKLPGYQCLVSRRGNEVLFTRHGLMDVERSRPVERDTIYRIYSMTKPVTSVALMMLYERGLFQLDDPVVRYIPQWKRLKVFANGDESRYEVKPLARPMTVKDLLTHTSGLTYGFMHSHPVDALYRSEQIGGLDRVGTLAEMIERLADIPLQFSPGERWNYSVSTDVVGYLVQLLADQDLDDFVAEKIADPLGMADSGFFVPPAKQSRLAACYERVPGSDGYRLQDDPLLDSPYLERPAFLSGGGGMVSTMDDYHRFTRMLRNGGELDGVRLLGRKTLAYMTTNHMPDNRDLAAMGQPRFSETPYDGIGFGLGFSVVLDAAAANVLDSPGEFAWGGAASTYFFIDPAEDLIVLFLTQLLPSSAYPIRRQLKALVYQALVD